jgi:hypothetical protein
MALPNASFGIQTRGIGMLTDEFEVQHFIFNIELMESGTLPAASSSNPAIGKQPVNAIISRHLP